MKTVTGYLVNIENPNFSGIATLTFCSEKPKMLGGKSLPQGEITRCYTEAGFGVRQIAAALGRNFELSPETELEINIDANGMLDSFEVVE
jgi:hypothetical protein